MAGPGGKVVGRVSIRVLPDTSTFGPALAGDLAAIERALSIEVPVSVDAGRVVEDLERIRGEVSAAAQAVKIPALLDAASVLPSLLNVRARAAAVAEAAPVNVPVQVASPSLTSDLALLRARIAGDVGAVTIGAELSTGQLIAQLAEARAITDATELTVDIGLDVNKQSLLTDLDDARRRIEDLTRKAASVRVAAPAAEDLAIRIPTLLSVDQDQINQQLLDLRDRVRGTFTGGLPVPFTFAGDDADLRQSLTDLQQRIAFIVADGATEIPLSFDGPQNRRRLESDLAILSRRLSADGGILELPIALTADQERVRQSLAGLQQQIQGLTTGGAVSPVQLSVVPTDGFAERFRGQLERELTAAKARIPVDVDSASLRLDLARAVSAAEAALRVDVPLDVDVSTGFIARAQAAVAEVQALVARANPTVEVAVEFDRRGTARQRLGELREAFNSVGASFAKLLRLTEAGLGIERFFTQLALILARSAAYAVLLGPPLVLAASGALALAPAFATALPFALGLAAQVGVIALGMDALFGSKIDGNRVGGPFQNLRDQIGAVKGEIGALLTQGVQPLSEMFQRTSFAAFTDGMKGVAAGTNLAITNFLKFGTSTQAVIGTEKVFASLTRQTSVFAQLVGPLAGTLLNVSVAAIPGFDRLNESLLRGGLRFAAFIDRVSSSGQLTQVIDQSVDDLIAFVSGVGRITGKVIEVLAALEPAARAAFGGLGDAVEGGLTKLTNFLDGAQLSGSPIEGLLVGIIDVVSVLRGIPGDVAAAFAPLVQSSEFSDFIVSLGAALVVAAQGVGVLSGAMSAVVAATLQFVVVPVLPFLTSVVDGLSAGVSVLSQHQALFGTLAVILAVRYVPALAAATVAARTFITVNIAGALSTAVTAIGAFVARIPVLIAGVRAFGVAALGVGASVRAMGAAFLAAAAPIAAIVLPLFAVVSAATAFSTAGSAVKAGADQIVQSTDATTLRGALDGMNELSGRMRALQAEDAKFEEQPAVKRWGEQFGQAFQQMFGGKNDILERAKGIEATADAISLIADKARNAQANIAAVSSSAGITADTVAEISKALGVDLTQGFNESADARQQIVTFMQKIATETGISGEMLSQFAASAGKSFADVSKAAQDAAKKVATAFARDTDVLGTLDLAKAQADLDKAVGARSKAQTKLSDLEERIAAGRKLTIGQEQQLERARAAVTQSSIEKRAAAQQRLSDLEERLAGKRNLTVAQAQSLEKAQLAVAEANKKVAESSQNTGADAIRAAYAQTITLAQTFTRDIALAYKAGLDPSVIARLLEAGPKQATPILEAILSDHSGRMVDLVNQSEQTLATLNQQVLAQQRILWVAMQSEAAAGSDKFLLQVNDAMRVSAELFASGGTTSINALAEKLKLPPDRIAEIAANFGFSQLLEQLQKEANNNPVDVRFRAPKSLTLPPGVEPNPVRGRSAAFRDGGLVTGPGSKTSDSILARISRGEFVQQAAAVDHYGVDVMRAINERRIPRDVLSGVAVKQLAAATKAVQFAAVDVKTLAASVARQPQAAPADRLVAAERASDTAVGARGGRRGSEFLLVDADGRLIGRMRGEAKGAAKARAAKRRLSRMGSWGEELGWPE